MVLCRLREPKLSIYGLLMPAKLCYLDRPSRQSANIELGIHQRMPDFGDLDDPNSEVSLALKDRKWKVLAPEAGTKPQLYFLT